MSVGEIPRPCTISFTFFLSPSSGLASSISLKFVDEGLKLNVSNFFLSLSKASCRSFTLNCFNFSYHSEDQQNINWMKYHSMQYVISLLLKLIAIDGNPLHDKKSNEKINHRSFKRIRKWIKEKCRNFNLIKVICNYALFKWPSSINNHFELIINSPQFLNNENSNNNFSLKWNVINYFFLWIFYIPSYSYMPIQIEWR